MRELIWRTTGHSFFKEKGGDPSRNADQDKEKDDHHDHDQKFIHAHIHSPFCFSIDSLDEKGERF